MDVGGWGRTLDGCRWMREDVMRHCSQFSCEPGLAFRLICAVAVSEVESQDCHAYFE